MNSAFSAPITRFVFATILIDAIGFGIVMPVLPQLVIELGHVDLADATRIGGWMAAVYALVQFLCGPLSGNLGDRFGRRPVLFAALGGFAIDYLLMGFAPSLLWLFVGRAIAGVFGASYSPAMAALADVTPPEQRAQAFGTVSAAFGLGFIIGPGLGGLLGEMGPRVPFIAAAAFSALNLLYGMLAFPETLAPEQRRRFEWKRANPLGALLSLRRMPGVLPVAGAFLLWGLASMVYPATWSFYAIAAFGWSPGMIGLSLMWVGATMALVQFFAIGPAVARFGERRTALIGLAGGIAGFVAFALIQQGWMVFAATLFIMLQSFVQPSLNALLSQRVPADAQGELQGFTGSLAALSAIAAPLMLNPALAWFTGPSAPFHFPGAAFAIAAVFGLLCFAILAGVREGPV